ncbi:UNVERIFIED_CONTAM: hypothetical protein Scaly_1268100 [Sesamum calycinum]|uniref:Uncharacterized protein ycf33 n=1 Tax=Sesamum calycinum TaxID=2727403 RepID=A0AAW2Q5F1_9LAMI
MRRYALYALTVSTGAIYTLLQPILELLKNPISAILVLTIIGGSIFIVSQVGVPIVYKAIIKSNPPENGGIDLPGGAEPSTVQMDVGYAATPCGTDVHDVRSVRWSSI